MSCHDHRVDEPAVERWERRSEWPLAATAFAFLIAYALPILDGGLSAAAHRACTTVVGVAWVVFLVDYVSRLLLARRRVTFVMRHLPDLATVALPVLRPLRLLRLLFLLRALDRRASQSLRGRIAVYVPAATVLLLVCAALAVLDAERGQPGANLETIGDAIWWAVTTVSTVGYGDHYPVTTHDRAVAVGLMIGGVALLGVITASVATWLVQRVSDAEHAEQAATRRDVIELRAQLEELTGEVRAYRSREAEDDGDLGAQAALVNLVGDSSIDHQHIHLSRGGRRAAVLLSADDYDAMRDVIAIISDAELLASHGAGRDAIDRGDHLDARELADAMRRTGRLPE